jgi:surface polysaccharide O-acyltransferase-like enzyme
MKRAAYFDNLRIALTILVIFHHTAIAYGALGGWCYITPETVQGGTKIALSSILAVDQAFFMSLFFFISAYMMPYSFDKKGFKVYIKDRFMRLGVPLLIYSVLIGPCLNYGIQVHLNSSPVNFPSFILKNVTKNPNTSHMWFVLALLIFESIYALYRKFPKLSISKLVPENAPTNWNIAIFIIVCGILAFLLRLVYPIGGKNIIGLQLGYFTLYIAMYILGIIARRKKWMDTLSYNNSIIWFVVAIIVIPLIVLAWIDLTHNPEYMVQYIGGFHLRSLFLSFWEAIVCVGICYFSIMAFRKNLDISTKMSINLAADSYAAYVIHPVVVVGVTILSEQLSLSPFIKFLIAITIIVIVCFILAHNIRKIPGLKKIL